MQPKREKPADVSIPDLATKLGIGECTAYRWAAKDLLERVDGSRLISGEFAAQLVKDWKRSCTQVEAGIRLSRSTSKVNEMLHTGELRGVEVPLGGKLRVLLSSIREAKNKPRAIKESDVVHPERRGFARLSREQALQFARRGRKSALIRLVSERSKFGTKRLLTIEEAVILVDQPETRVRELVRLGKMGGSKG
jgi:hypothetical protein